MGCRLGEGLAVSKGRLSRPVHRLGDLGCHGCGEALRKAGSGALTSLELWRRPAIHPVSDSQPQISDSTCLRQTVITNS